jgi:hypothetical protein
MTSLITFSPQFPGWSAFTFWAVAISIPLTLAFTLAIFIGGLRDLAYLLRSLDEEDPDHNESIGL